MAIENFRPIPPMKYFLGKYFWKSLALRLGIVILICNVSFFFVLGAVCLGAASRILKSKFEKTAAAVVVGVVGIGLLVGSLSLFANPVQTGPFGNRIVNVCAPVISSITVTDDGSAGLRVSVDFSHGWDMFTWVSPSITGLSHWEWYGYDFETKDAVRHYRLKRGNFHERFSYFSYEFETWDGVDYDVPVHFDYFVRGGSGGTRGSGGKYFEMEITPAFYGLVPVRAKHYYSGDHWVKITLYVTNFGGP